MASEALRLPPDLPTASEALRAPPGVPTASEALRAPLGGPTASEALRPPPVTVSAPWEALRPPGRDSRLAASEALRPPPTGVPAADARLSFADVICPSLSLCADTIDCSDWRIE